MDTMMDGEHGTGAYEAPAMDLVRLSGDDAVCASDGLDNRVDFGDLLG